ncbi:MAG: hypothetical protein AAB403_03330 [Planctomycetota bacterium]
MDDVIQLVQAGLSEDLVIAKVKKNGKAFDLSTNQLLQLKKAGVSDNVIRALLDPSAELAPQAPAPPPAPAAPPTPSPDAPSSQPSPSTQPVPPADAPLTPVAAASLEKPGDYDEFKRLLFARYDGKVLIPIVSGLSAGEYKKAFVVGPGKAGLLWYHYHQSVPIPDRKRSNPLKLWGKKTAEMDQLDERTFADLDKGLNVTPIDKGELLKVQKFYVMSDHIEFNLTTTRLGHLRDLDVNKASKETTTTVTGTEVRQKVSVAGFGLRFRFFFDKDSVLKAAKYDAVVSEISKYLLPKDEAEKILTAERNIDIDLGMSEEAVIQKLGQPLRSIKIGDQKSLRYKDMTVILKDGKVTEVKFE